MGWKFSSSCHIDSSFSERNLPIMHTSSKRALGWSLRAHSTLIPGLLWGQRRSSLQHLDSLEGAKHCLIHGMLIMSGHTLSVRCTQMHHHYEVNINTAATSLSICFYFVWVWTRRRGRMSFQASEKSQPVKELVLWRTRERRANYAKIYRPFCIFLKNVSCFFPTPSKAWLSLQDKCQCYS